MNQIARAPARAFAFDELKTVLSSGLMSFPLTDFDAAGEFDEAGYRRLEWLMGQCGRRSPTSPRARSGTSRR